MLECYDYASYRISFRACLMDAFSGKSAVGDIVARREFAFVFCFFFRLLDPAIRHSSRRNSLHNILR